MHALNAQALSVMRRVGTRTLSRVRRAIEGGYGSFRFRTGVLVALVLASAVAVMTLVTIVQVRRELAMRDTAYGAAVIDHLVAMQTPLSTSHEVREHIGRLQPYLDRVGAAVELLPADDDSGATDGRLALLDGEYRLRYVTRNDRMAGLTRRAVVVHLAQGVIALVVLLLLVEWSLRRRIFGPLDVMRRQLEHIRRGGHVAWLPPVDRELADLSSAVQGIGPAVESQIAEWVETDRRATVAVMFARITRALMPPLRSALVVSERIAANNALPLSARRDARAVRNDLEAAADIFAWCEEDAVALATDGGNEH